MVDAPIRELARAKINLTLHVTGRRPDGLHMLDSLVVFADLGDVVEVEAGSRLSLVIDGPFGSGIGATPDNLVLRAARHLGVSGALRLTKALPVSSGIGGGSADAAATIRAMSRLHGLTLPAAADLTTLGADVPVCLASVPTRMRGIGEVLRPVPTLPAAWLVLVNPGVGMATPAVFARLDHADNAPMDMPDSFGDFDGFVKWLTRQRNDLQFPAEQLSPVIGEVLTALHHGTPFARMSGSGATCFGLYAEQAAALSAADRLRDAHPGWWVAAAPVGR